MLERSSQQTRGASVCTHIPQLSLPREVIRQMLIMSKSCAWSSTFSLFQLVHLDLRKVFSFQHFLWIVCCLHKVCNTEMFKLNYRKISEFVLTLLNFHRILYEINYIQERKMVKLQENLFRFQNQESFINLRTQLLSGG